MTLIIAHRGASRAEPENTVAAFLRAGEMGADGVELDVRRTADDHLVVHHDAVLADGRTIRATPRAELPVTVPELSDAIDACAGMFVNVEIKNDPTEPDFDPGEWVAHRVMAVLAARRTDRRWLISSFRPETVAVCRRLQPAIATAQLCSRPDDPTIARTAEAGHAAIHPSVVHLTDTAVRRAHAAGLAVNTWTCNDPVRIRELIAWGVDGICTDAADVALGVRAACSG